MWGYGPGWGPMYGWWIMPLIGLLFMVVFLFIIFRFFGSKGGFCDMKPMDHSGEDDSVKELKNEIQALRDEIKELKNKGKRGDVQ